MLNLRSNILKLQSNISFLMRHVGNNINKACSFETSFSPEDSDKILQILNQSDPHVLLKFKISLTRVKDIINRRSDRGPFKSLTDVLQISGIGEDMLKKMCNNILVGDVTRLNMKSRRHMKNILTPNIKFNTIHTLQSAVAIHVDTVGISWAIFQKSDNTLTQWFCENFGGLPEKLSPAEIFELALKILRRTPPGDVYIFESSGLLGPQSKSKPNTLCSYNQQIDLLSMLLALLNTSSIHNKGLQNSSSEESSLKIENRVFYVKATVPARLFKTFIGSEKVSATEPVTEFLIPSFKNPVDLVCTTVNLNNNLKEMFINASATDKELLSRSVMLGCAFMDLFIYRNPDSFEALNGTRKNI